VSKDTKDDTLYIDECIFPLTLDMTDQLASENSNRPSNVGDDSNLPPDVRAVAGLRSAVVAWSSKDPKCGYDWAATRRMACLIACFPLFFYKANDPIHDRTYWILTETELKVLVVNYEEYFLPGIKQSCDIVHTIPLDKITACGVKTSHWFWSFPYIYVEVSETAQDYGKIDVTHTMVGLALAGQDWLAREILHRRNTLDATVGTNNTSSPDGIPPPSTKTYGQVARFGNHDNAPNAVLRWAQQGQYRVVAWTTHNPPQKQGFCLFILLRGIAWCYFFLALILSSPLLIYMLVRVANGHPLLLFLYVAGTVFATMLLWSASFEIHCLSEQLEDNYWVLTEKDLFVLTKRQVPFHSLDINRKIPLLSIARCEFTTSRQGLLDRWGATLPTAFISTTSKEHLEFRKEALALAKNEWFLLQVLNQRDKARSHEAAIEVLA
jgi:hypothetical protein